MSDIATGNFSARKKTKASWTRPSGRARIVRVTFSDPNTKADTCPADEIANLRKQAQAFRAVRLALRSASDDPDAAAKAAFQKVCRLP